MGPALLSPLIIPWAVLEEDDEEDEVGEGRPWGANKRPSDSRSASSRASSCGARQKEEYKRSAEPLTRGNSSSEGKFLYRKGNVTALTTHTLPSRLPIFNLQPSTTSDRGLLEAWPPCLGYNGPHL